MPNRLVALTTVTVIGALASPAPASAVAVAGGHLPSAPRHVVAITQSRHSIAVGWHPPKDNGGDRIRHYRVEFASCRPGAPGCHFDSRLTPRARHHVTLTGLAPGATYKIRVTAHTRAGDGPPSKTLHVTT